MKRRLLLAKVRQALCVVLTFALVTPSGLQGAEREDVAIAGLEFGVSIGKLLWVSVANKTASTAPPDRYSALAQDVRGRIEMGRAASDLVRSNFELISTAVAYGAVANPEPLSKGAMALAAWGASKTGDLIGAKVLDQAQEQARGILAQGLKNSGLSTAELQNMKPDDLRARVAEMVVGGEKLGDILKDDQPSLNMLQAHSVDIARTIGVEALALAKGTEEDVASIKAGLAATNKKFSEYQAAVGKHLDAVDSSITKLEAETVEANKKLGALRSEVNGNTAAIRSLAEISYSGWTTGQKLQAVQSGLYPTLDKAKKDAVVASLQAELKREAVVADFNKASQALGQLGAIASNLGLPPKMVTDLQRAQTVATGIAQFASGNVLGGISSLTSLAGLGPPDAAAERHAEMMKYLNEQFTQVNKKLDTIIDLQIKTLEAIDALGKTQRALFEKTFGQLDRIEERVLSNQMLLQAILLNEWQSCHSFVNGSGINGTFEIGSTPVLTGLLKDGGAKKNAENCYSQMTEFLTAWVKPAAWSGQTIASNNFPQTTIAPDTQLTSDWNAFEKERSQAYRAAALFLSSSPQLGSDQITAALRLAQPINALSSSIVLEATLTAESAKLQAFNCKQTGVFSDAMKDLMCFGVAADSAVAPNTDRLSTVLSAPLIGPYAVRILDTGMPLSMFVDFATTEVDGAFNFVGSDVVTQFAKDGPSDHIRKALAESKGRTLLRKLQWLSEAIVLQQSTAYGDYTARLVESKLYRLRKVMVAGMEKQVGELSSDASQLDLAGKLALNAMKANPILARNVVMLAMRHAIEDSLDGATPKERAKAADSIAHRRTFYSLALGDYAGPKACHAGSGAESKLRELFPGFAFHYRATAAEKQAQPEFQGCLDQNQASLSGGTFTPSFGQGIVVTVGDFYVQVPSALALSAGLFEQPASLRLALQYRDRLSQVSIDRNFLSSVRQVAGEGTEGAQIAAQMAIGLLDEGWGWRRRRKTTESQASVQ